MGKRAYSGLKVLSRQALIGGFAAAPVLAECAPGSLTLRGDWGQARFSVEVADTNVERAQGLMNRESMPSGAGMLFIYEKPQTASFWMRNTLIPLDLLFADAQGVVQHIHHKAIPLDETPIPGGDNVLYVLEINGGLADAMRIGVGSEMRHAEMMQENAAWRCD